MKTSEANYGPVIRRFLWARGETFRGLGEDCTQNSVESGKTLLRIHWDEMSSVLYQERDRELQDMLVLFYKGAGREKFFEIEQEEWLKARNLEAATATVTMVSGEAATAIDLWGQGFYVIAPYLDWNQTYWLVFVVVLRYFVPILCR